MVLRIVRPAPARGCVCQPAAVFPSAEPLGGRPAIHLPRGASGCKRPSGTAAALVVPHPPRQHDDLHDTSQRRVIIASASSFTQLRADRRPRASCYPQARARLPGQIAVPSSVAILTRRCCPPQAPAPGPPREAIGTGSESHRLRRHRWRAALSAPLPLPLLEPAETQRTRGAPSSRTRESFFPSCSVLPTSCAIASSLGSTRELTRARRLARCRCVENWSSGFVANTAKYCVSRHRPNCLRTHLRAVAGGTFWQRFGPRR
jgi:hypothetical protein